MDKLSKSPRINNALHEMNIYSYLDVIKHLPRRYEFIELSNLTDIKDKARITIFAKITSEISKSSSNKAKMVSFSVTDYRLRRNYNVIAFNREYLTKTLSINQEITLWGIYDYRFNQINLINYFSGPLDDAHKVKPIYTLVEPLENYTYSRLVHKALIEKKEEIYSLVPYLYQDKYKLISKYDSFYKAHFPSSKEDIHQALRHLKYEEALIFSIKNQLIKEENKSLAKIKKEAIDYDICEPFTSSLPFTLTNDQINACKEIIEDMNQSSLMYRLLQGDVGSGKTVVSFVALYANYYRGDQGAIMAPTDALARQHYKSALDLFKNTKIRIALLVGSTSIKEKEEIYQDLADGYIDIVIGTHALFTKKVNYSSLGLVIIDEQHRFGVNQRQALLDKGKHADLLMMSATPIPRSLALTIYGDLDITTLSTFPTKTKDVVTKIVSYNDNYIFRVIDRALELKQRIYVVAPLINEKVDRTSVEKLYDLYNKKYPSLVSLLHGGMKADEKNEALDKFIIGETPILVSTQVIEVGIDVKNASVMVIYDADNFGLASLHQLRGRIGRDGTKAICMLVADKSDLEAVERLDILVDSFDGFKIAEVDMKNRGPGDLSGIRQSGLPNFAYLNMIDDVKVFITAREDAKYILSHLEEKQFSYTVNYVKRLLMRASKDEYIKA